MTVVSETPSAVPDDAPAARWLPGALAGVAGCLFLVAAASSSGMGTLDGLPSFLSTPVSDYRSGAPSDWQAWVYLAAPAIAAAVGLCLLRWWPYLLAAAGLIAVPTVVSEWGASVSWLPPAAYLWVFFVLPAAGSALAVIAVLGCAQGLIRTGLIHTGLIRTGAGWGAAVTALTLGSRLAGSAIPQPYPTSWLVSPHAAAAWHTALLAAGFAGVAPAAWLFRRGVPAASADGRPWQRVRLVAAGTLAAAVPVLLSFLTTQRLAGLLGVTWDALERHAVAQTGVIGTLTVAAVTLLAALAGRWPLAGALTAAVAQVAVVWPVILTLTTMDRNDPLRFLAALAGAALGAAAAGTRRRVPLAATLTVLAAMALFIAYAATTGTPEKLAEQQAVIPAILILVLCAAAAGAVIGATAPALAARGALPAALGPLAGTIAVGGMQGFQVTSVSDGESLPSFLSPALTSAVLFLVAGAAIGGLGFAQLLATRSAERKHAEQIRREAADAERDRLGRSIHDGVLQVLALVQREGPELGAQGSELAALAGEQEAALRGLLTGAAGAGAAAAAGGSTPGTGSRETGRPDADDDLRAALQALSAPDVEVAAPAHAVKLPPGVTSELVAAVRAALDNVRKHAGDGARAWVLLEDERDGVRLSVRDDGAGIPAGRLDEAAAAGRLGVAQSMRGRIADCGGTTTIDSKPGEGTEVEFWVPRARR